MYLMIYPGGTKGIELPSQCHRVRKKTPHSNPVGSIGKPCHGQSQVHLGIIQYNNDFRGRIQIFKVNKPTHHSLTFINIRSHHITWSLVKRRGLTVL